MSRSNVVELERGASEYRSKSFRFRELLSSRELEFIMEAHNGLSAKIVEETGFKGIWASGLTISSALGVRDSNEASWTQVLEVLEFMSDATTVPIMLDGDTGYGNFNNFRRLVRKLGQRDVAAVCIEDKLFPKTNSFIGESQPLADVEEFCGKIKAGKDSQLDDDFSVVARIEALISGWGLDEALRRGEAYHAAGADAVLIHSKKSTADEILAFKREWGDRCPVVIVPTTYAGTPTEKFSEAGISLIIWANHNLRAAINAMRETSERIFASQSLHDVEERVATVAEVFGLAGNKELAEAEDRYLAARKGVNAILLAASRGAALRELTEDKPKCMLDVRGQPLLRRLSRSFNDAGVQQVTVVAGYKADAITLGNVRKVENAAYETTGEAASLACARDRLDGPAIVGYGDILFRGYMLNMLFDSEAEIAVAVDADWRRDGESAPKSGADLVKCSVPYSADLADEGPVVLEQVGGGLSPEAANGQWVGLMRLNEAGSARVQRELDAMAADGSLATADLAALINRLIAGGAKPEVVYVTGDWLDVNDAFDLARARNFT